MIPGPQCWGQRGGAVSRGLPTPPTPREVVSLHLDYNPTLKTQKKFRGGEVERRRTSVHEKQTSSPLVIQGPPAAIIAIDEAEIDISDHNDCLPPRNPPGDTAPGISACVGGEMRQHTDGVLASRYHQGSRRDEQRRSESRDVQAQRRSAGIETSSPE